MFVNDQPITSMGRPLLVALSLLILAAVGCEPSGSTTTRPSTSGPPPTDERTNMVEEPPESQPSSSQPLDRTFDDLALDIEVGKPYEPEALTPEIEAMVGKPIRIRGYMLPGMQRKGIKQFVLIRDNQVCCFGPGAAIYHCIRVSLADGNGVKLSMQPVVVTGTLEVDPFIGPDGNHWAVFSMDATQVEY